VPQSNMPDSEVTARFGPRIYVPLSQNPTLSGFQFTVRMHPSTLLRPIAEVERELREISRGVNREITLYRIMLLSDPIELNASGITAILGMFAAAAVGALVLSVISIYGLISRSVLARTGEMGIRRAMGASDLRIVKIFLYQGLLYLGVAFVFGGGLGAIAMSAAQSSLTSISGFNAMIIFSSIFTTVTVVVGILVLTASYVPTRRLVTMEPGEALHYE
ncbi:MAG: FtsX-like permease family protein, partial [Pseudomonadales bacterium]|nr:FtsX-like permease family protein [Pseudomonadales bacterium]